ncbi:hypothetical protein BGZ94_006071, partial [Podila epigama]
MSENTIKIFERFFRSRHNRDFTAIEKTMINVMKGVLRADQTRPGHSQLLQKAIFKYLRQQHTNFHKDDAPLDRGVIVQHLDTIIAKHAPPAKFENRATKRDLLKRSVTIQNAARRKLEMLALQERAHEHACSAPRDFSFGHKKMWDFLVSAANGKWNEAISLTVHWDPCHLDDLITSGYDLHTSASNDPSNRQILIRTAFQQLKKRIASKAKNPTELTHGDIQHDIFNVHAPE